MAWFKREKKRIEQPTPPDERRVKTEGLWTKCENCRTTVWKKDLEANWRVCPKCQHHFRLNATQRLELLLDSRWVEYDAALASNDPLHFTDTRPYAARLKDARRKLGMADAIITAEGLLAGRPVICCSMEFKFIGGSMGAVVGEKVTRAIETAIAKKLPLVIISCSGGARMMEGTISLMQLAKVSAALARLDEVRAAVYLRPYRSDHRRRHRQLRHAGRHQHCRTGRADRIRGAARDRADHPAETSRWISNVGISPGAWFSDAVVHRKDLKTYISSALDFFLA